MSKFLPTLLSMSARKCAFVAAYYLAVVISPSGLGAQAASAAVNVASHRRIIITALDGTQTLMAAADSGGTVVGAAATASANVAPFVAGRNPYVGAQLGYAFGDNGQFASSLLASGSVMYSVIEADPKSTAAYKFFLPVRGNFGSLATETDTATRKKNIEDLVTSTRGLRVAVEPYVLLTSIGTYIHPVLIGSAGWKLNATKDPNDTTRYLALGRFSAGLEFGIGPSDGSKLPITVDLNWVHTTFAGDSYKKVFGETSARRLSSGEFTIVVPVATNTALLTEAIATRNARPVWRIGIVLVASKDN